MVPMTRLGNKLFTSVLALLTSVSLLAGCGGGGSHVGALPQPAATQAPAYTGPLSDATFVITIPPPPKTSAKLRSPSYVSSSTSKIVFTLNTASRLTAGQVTSFNTSSLGTVAVTLNSATCPGSGPWTCTLTIKLPPGTDNLTISAQDSSSNILSQQIQNFTVTAGGTAAGANHFSTTLDANANVMTVTGSGFCAVGAVANASTFGSVGTQTVTFSVGYTDLAGKAIISPGLPILAVNGHTDTNGGAGYNDAGSGGIINVKVTQSTQSYTITPSTAPMSATVAVTATPANTNTTSDGLAFTKSDSYTFSTGVAPPLHNFLAAIEQTGANSGKIDLFNMTIGGTSGSADTFSAFSPASLAVTGSTNQAGVSDVDNPLAIAWDVNGDLLIANGGSGAAADPNGNFACVPVGSIATGSAQSTTVTQNVDVPESLAYGPHGTVGLADSAGTVISFSEYVLTGNYTAASGGATGAGTPNVTHAQEGNDGGTFAVALPTLSGSTDTFAVALFGGTTPKVTIVTSSGGLTDITDANISHPDNLAWDSTNNELVIGNDDGSHTDVLTYTLSPNTKQQTINTSDTNYYTAAAPDGKLAVAGASFTGASQVFIYSSSVAARTLVATIPFNAVDTAAHCNAGAQASQYLYEPGVITSMSWLSATKLMISLNASQTPSNNGIYIFDVSASQTNAGVDDITCNPEPNGPKQTGFHQITNKPLGTAFKS
jgi:hypothetical protein